MTGTTCATTRVSPPRISKISFKGFDSREFIKEKLSTGEQGWWATEWLADRLQLWWRQQLPTNLPTPASGHVICHINASHKLPALFSEGIYSYVFSCYRIQRDKLPFLFLSSFPLFLLHLFCSWFFFCILLQILHFYIFHVPLLCYFYRTFSNATLEHTNPKIIVIHIDTQCVARRLCTWYVLLRNKHFFHTHLRNFVREYCRGYTYVYPSRRERLFRLAANNHADS